MTLTWVIGRGGRSLEGQSMSSFKLKLVVYFLLLSLLPLAAAFAGFASVAKDSETRLVDTRLQAGLHPALPPHEERLLPAEDPPPRAPPEPTFHSPRPRQRPRGR